MAVSVAFSISKLPPRSVPEPTTEATAPERKWVRPPPTEHWLEDGAETRNKQRRKAWFKEIHKAAPGVDYKAIEKQNGLAQIDKRNHIADAPELFDHLPDPIPVWVERGSSNQSGRMHVATHSPDQTMLYAGSSKGGVWKRTLGSDDWVAIGDNLYGGAHWLVVLPPDNDGEPNVVIASTDGGFMHRSADDGATWNQLLTTSRSVRRLLVTSDGAHVAFVIRQAGNTWSLLRSVDNGVSFQQIHSFGGYAGDIWMPRDGGGELYMVDDDELMISDDYGDNWTVAGPLGTDSESAELVGSEAGAPRLWAIVDEEALYRSDDAGASWSHIAEVSDYWRSLNASVDDADVFAWGGVEVHRTFDGGEHFDIVNGWGDYYGAPHNQLHADIPGIDVLLDGDGQEIWYISTDGGLYESTDGLHSVTNLSLDGLRVSQYYSTLTSSANPDHIAAGAQDQGYQLSNWATQYDDLVPFDQLISGDYGHLISGDGTHEYVYSVYPGFILAQVGEDNTWLDYIDYPPAESSEYFAWLPPLHGDSANNADFFFCATHLYHYVRQGDGWTPQLWSDHDFQEGDWEYLSAFEISPLNDQRAYAATSYGQLFYSEDRGVTWNKSDDLGPEGHYFYGTAMKASLFDPDLVWVAGSGYNATAVYISTDGGRSYEPWDDGLPETLVYAIEEAPDGSGRLFAATETSAYMRAPDADEWVDITGADAPVTTYWSLEALTVENTMRFGTYGRGIWDFQLDPDHIGCYPVQDYDGDGVDCDEDCDDHDPAITPGLADECDGIDINCDDQDPIETDGDEDGYLACAECDDGDGAIHPDAEEICGNGIDEDCDGADADCEGGCQCSLPSSRRSHVSLGFALTLLFLLRRRFTRG